MDDRATSIAPRLTSRSLLLSVVKVREGSALAHGQVFETHQERVLVGRDASADVRLNDRTVSRQHAVIVDDGRGFVLENVSERGSTFVERQRVGYREVVRLAADDAHVQLGGVLLRVRSGADTTAFQDAMSVDEVVESRPGAVAAGSGPLLSIEWDAGRCHVRLGGKMLAIYPAAARVLAALCATPGQPVHRFDLEDALADGGSLEQQVSLLRRLFADEVEAGTLPLDVVRAHVRAHLSGAQAAGLETMDAREVLRRFIGARRGYGYVLCLDPSEVHVDDGSGP
jgi:hypothetical protein